ncbi:MAG: endo-1,4-beta-xylanase [Luteolibacter sp.]
MKSAPIDPNALLRRATSLLVRVCGVVFLTVAAHAESLREAAAGFPGLRVSAAIKSSSLTGGTAAYANTVRYEFNAASPENDLKWGTLRPTQSSFAWANADAIANFNRAAGQQMRGHTFQWYKSSSLPTWLTGGGFTAPQLQAVLYDHIDQVGAHYRGDCLVWDVVNEAFNDNGTLRTGNFWYDAPGIGYAGQGTRYIEETFIRASAADPDALLFYNDYGAEEDNAKSDAIYAMAQDFLNRGVPLDGIGFQMHIAGISYSSLRTNFKRFNDLGLDLHITEMDVRVPVDANGEATPASLDSQAEIYWNVLGVALGQPHFKGFQTWGLYDGDSWIPGFFPGYGAALLFDELYQRKPAYWAVWNAMANQAEKMPVLDFSAGDSTGVFSQDTLSAGAGRQLIASGPDDFMTLALAVPFAGQWDVKVGYRKSGASGKFQLAVAPESGSFTNVGGVVDAYGALVGTGEADFGNVTFSDAGNRRFRFTVAGRNASSTAHNLTIDYIRITPVATPGDTPPTVTNTGDKTIAENKTAGPYSFTIADAQTAAGALTVKAVSLNETLLPSSSIMIGGSAGSRTVTLTPAANRFGTAAVLLLVSDGFNTTPESFTLNVTEVDYNPKWTRTTTGTQTWSTSSNWLPAVVPSSFNETRLRFFEGMTLAAGTVTASNNIAGTFSLNGLTLGGTGASGTASGVTLSGSPLVFSARSSDGALPAVNLDANKNPAGGSSLNYSVSHNIILNDSTTFIGEGNADFNCSGILSGAGSLTKRGGSVLKLSGTNSYTGPTTVHDGTLLVQNPGSLAAASTVSVKSGGIIGGTGSISGSVVIEAGGTVAPGGPNAVGTLALANAGPASLILNDSALAYGLSTIANSDKITVAGDLVLNGASVISLSLPPGQTPLGTYTLMTYAARTGPGTLSLLGSWPNATLNVGVTSVTLTVFIPQSIWTGATNNVWDTGTANWLKNGVSSSYAAGDVVIFDDTAVGNFSISGNASPYSITVNNSANNYTLSGNIGGTTTPLSKSGTGTLALTGANTYTGNTTLGGGVLDIGAVGNGSLGGGALLFSNGGILQGSGVFTRPFSGNATPANGEISGIDGGFAAKGGTLTINFGGLAVPAGIALSNGSFRFGTNLVFGSATSDSPVVVANPVSLGGANRTVTVNSGTGGDYAEFSGVVSDVWGINKNGSGLLVLSGNNANTGKTTVNAGTIRAAHNNALGISAATVALAGNDACLEIANGITVNRALTISDTGNRKMMKLQSTATAGDYTGTILISETTPSNFELSSLAGQVFTISGKISGTAGGAVNKSGAGTVRLTAANDYTTPTVISEGGINAATLANAGVSSSIGAASDISGNLVLNGGTLRHDAANVAATNRKFATGLNGATIDSSAAASTDIVNFTTSLAMGFNGQLGPRTLTLAGSNPGENTINMDLNDDGADNPTGVVKQGTGKWTITGTSNDYTGNTTVSAGTLVLADNAGMKFLVTDSSSNSITGSGTVVLNGDFTINTTAVTATGGSWILVNAATLIESFGNTFTVVGWTESADEWTKVDGVRTWTFSEATGVLSVKASDSYESWISGFTNIPLAGRGPGDDPDGDGSSNLLEFALKGNPEDPLDNGLIASLLQDSGSSASNKLMLILAVRAGATFAAGSATISGIIYSVEGSPDLAFPSAAVSSTGPSDTAPAATGLPGLAGTGWEYHIFTLDAPESLPGKGFLRLKVTRP